MDYVFDGQRVMAPVGKMGTPLLCVVVCAMGNTARVTNPMHGVDTWADVDELQPDPMEDTDGRD